jgi:hypothetical protein
MWSKYLKDRLKSLSPTEQWLAWQTEYPEYLDKNRPKGWKGWPD